MVGSSTFLSLVAAAAACAAAAPIFVPGWDAYFFPKVEVISCVWALISVYPLLSQTWVFVRQCFVTMIVSAGMVSLLAALGPDVRLVVLVLSFPLPVFYCLCGPAYRTPFAGTMVPGLACIVHYGVLAFGPADPVMCARLSVAFVQTFAMGCAAALVSHIIFSVLFCHRQSLGACDTDAALRSCLEALARALAGVGSGIEGEEKGTLRERVGALNEAISKLDDAVKGWASEFWSLSPDASALAAVQAALVGWHAVLCGLVEATQGGLHLPPGAEVIAEEFEDLRVHALAAVEGLGHFALDASLEAEVVAQVRAAGEAAARLDAAVAARRGELAAGRGAECMEAAELARAMFAVASWRRMPGLLGDLHSAMSTARIGALAARPGISSRACGRLWADLRGFLVDVPRPEKYFAAMPADAILEGGEPARIWRRARGALKYPMRFTATLHLGALILILLAQAAPESTEYRLWALLPAATCFLPSSGAVIQKSLRRVAGTVLGGLLAMACIYFSPREAWVFVLELFVVTFLGKYASMHPRITYGGVTFGFTWIVVALRSWEMEVPAAERIEVALWRIGMTAAGVVYALVCSLALMPCHATVEFEHESAECLLCTVEAVLVWSAGAASSAVGPTASNIATAHSERLEPSAQTAAMSSLEHYARASLPRRLALLAEAKAERTVVSRVCHDLVGLQASLQALGDLGEAVRRIDFGDEHGEGENEDEAGIDRFFAAVPNTGPALARSIAHTREAMRQCALCLALRLRGIRTPVTARGSGARKLRSTMRHLRQRLEAVRKEAAESAAEGVASEDLRAVFASMFGLHRFAARFLELLEHAGAAAPDAPAAKVTRAISLEQKQSIEEDDEPSETSQDEDDSASDADVAGALPARSQGASRAEVDVEKGEVRV